MAVAVVQKGPEVQLTRKERKGHNVKTTLV